jgi:hypothetical protein
MPPSRSMNTAAASEPIPAPTMKALRFVVMAFSRLIGWRSTDVLLGRRHASVTGFA